MTNLESADDGIERELAQALAVEPSPEFLARLRAVVAADSMRSAWPRAWAWIGFAVSGAGVCVALAVSGYQPLELPPLRELPRTHVTAPVVFPPYARAPEPDLREALAKRPRRLQVVSSFRFEPEVLVAPDEAATLKRLMRGLRSGQVEPSTLTRTGSGAAGPPPPIVVSPIPRITPIAIEPLGLEGGARQ